LNDLKPLNIILMDDLLSYFLQRQEFETRPFAEDFLVPNPSEYVFFLCRK
jgi:hypothetical protein